MLRVPIRFATQIQHVVDLALWRRLVLRAHISKATYLAHVPVARARPLIAVLRALRVHTHSQANRLLPIVSVAGQVG